MKVSRVSIHIARKRADMEKAFRIREIIFTRGQHVPKCIEHDEFDEARNVKHVLLFLGGKPVGASRVRFEGKAARLQRMAVLKQFRGRGLGKALVRYLVSYSRRHGAKKAVVHAQYYLKQFYSSLGFVVEGKPFQEARMKHITMVHAL